ncbi:MAG TPA: hypothetical protein PKC21_08575 [Oligoflexia bacterium]|nr:hypothetical protein [Oligoflexia bacterium]HMR25394.1 hypothetical protein [Oligoflexia bacterium]
MNPDIRPMLLFSSVLEANAFMSHFLKGQELIWSFAHHYGYSMMDKPFKLTCVVSGFTPEKATKGLESALERFSQTNVVIGLGVCSALIKTAMQGDICLAKRVQLENDKTYIIGDQKLRILQESCEDNNIKVLQALYTCSQHLQSSTEKAAVHVASQCDVYDTSSAAWVKVALEQHKSCFVFKTVADNAQEIISPDFLASMDKFGHLRAGKVFLKRIFNPRLYKSLQKLNPKAMRQLLQPQAQMVYNLLSGLQNQQHNTQQETVKRENPQLSLLDPAQ